MVAWVCGIVDAVDRRPRERAVLGGHNARPLARQDSVATHHTALIVNLDDFIRHGVLHRPTGTASA